MNLIKNYTKLSKSDKFILLFLGIPTVIFIIYTVMFISVKKMSLSNNIEYTYAIVDSIHSSFRGRNRLYYDFFAGEIQYRGTGTYYPNNLEVSVGDSILVVYDNNNPNNTESLLNYNTDRLGFSYLIPILLLTGLYYFWKWWRKKKKQEVSNIDSRN